MSGHLLSGLSHKPRCAARAAALVRFEPRTDDREAAFLGVIQVGEIGPGPYRNQFTWRTWLPYCEQLGRAPTPKAAREYLASRVEQWVEAAGLVGAK